MKTWTMAQAKSDFVRGLLRGASLHFHNAMGDVHFVVELDSTLIADGSGMLVDARTGKVREFKTMDAAHAAIRSVGFRFARFIGSMQ